MVRLARVLMCGAKKVGKTAILSQIANGINLVGQPYCPTIEDTYFLEVCTEKSTDMLILLDTAGLDDLEPLPKKNKFQAADAVILVCSVDQPYSTAFLDVFPFLVFLNKIDLNIDGQFSNDISTVANWCKKEKVRFFQVDASNVNVLVEPFKFLAGKLFSTSKIPYNQPDSVSKCPVVSTLPFSYSGLRWRVVLSENSDAYFDPLLTLHEPGANVRCVLDFGFTLINQDSFTQNESYQLSRCRFDQNFYSQGKRCFIAYTDLRRRKFLNSARQCLIELKLNNAETIFEDHLKMITHDNGQVSTRNKLDYQCYNTLPFCVFCPNMDDTNLFSKHMLQLNRCSSSNLLCKLRYCISIGESDERAFKFVFQDEIFGFNGTGEGIYFTENYQKYVKKNELKITIKLYHFSYVCQLKLGVPSLNNPLHSICYDQDKRPWHVVTRYSQNCNIMKVTVIFVGSLQIPKNYCRLVTWSFCIVPAKQEMQNQDINFSESPISVCYFPQHDPGISFFTSLSKQTLRSKNNPWIDSSDGKITSYLEWHSSYLIAVPAFQSMESAMQKQVEQMRYFLDNTGHFSNCHPSEFAHSQWTREVKALQDENLNLEKELHRYHMMIAHLCNRKQNDILKSRSISSNSRGEQQPMLTKCMKEKDKQHSEFESKIPPTRESRRFSCVDFRDTKASTFIRRSSMQTAKLPKTYCTRLESVDDVHPIASSSYLLRRSPDFRNKHRDSFTTMNTIPHDNVSIVVSTSKPNTVERQSYYNKMRQARPKLGYHNSSDYSIYPNSTPTSQSAANRQRAKSFSHAFPNLPQ
ncbi:NF-kappa-B inhibitor-interacting Ras-like protein 1 [Trichinella zimbabwensis]|uniref:NF-kappa-B inhibitor-interacting Ras-like protein 1 n=1 Tax=Trichinella zimbabwensis TaxID=268475 RepID=A0A0V1HAD2_9BILA|nr:NF-kappa-B inhibitor-interacting Ras-like protein 1 [Trichinella zimbabwensis]